VIKPTTSLRHAVVLGCLGGVPAPLSARARRPRGWAREPPGPTTTPSAGRPRRPSA